MRQNTKKKNYGGLACLPGGRGTADYKFAAGGFRRSGFCAGKEVVLDPEGAFAGGGALEFPISGGVEEPGLGVVPEIGFQGIPEPDADVVLEDGEHEFYPAVQVPGHPVRAGQVQFFRAAVGKVEDPGMFQIPVDDASYYDIFRESRYAGYEGADTPDAKQDL